MTEIQLWQGWGDRYSDGRVGGTEIQIWQGWGDRDTVMAGLG